MASLIPRRPSTVCGVRVVRMAACPLFPSRLASSFPSRPASRTLSTTTAAELEALLARVAAAPASDDSSDGVHVIHSAGRDPYANLSVEHRLFQAAHPATRLLFLYRNAPCVVLGRNQNPWAEVDLRRLSGRVQLVRRRSGGGAVYHDAGNANWSVHFPVAAFDRDRHAAMVARALQRLGVASARVNARHDIVVEGHGGPAEEMRDADASESESKSDVSEYKVSGSAYKLTRTRAMHHGTCLLGADLSAVSGLLRAPPAAPFLLARGVASVKSPVQNVALADGDEDRFGDAVAAEFEAMYGAASTRATIDVDALAATGGFAFDAKLAAGYAEITTPDWLYGQTPRFLFSTQPHAEDPRPRPRLPPGVPPGFRLSFVVRNRAIEEVQLAGLSDEVEADVKVEVDTAATEAITGQTLHAIADWRTVLAAARVPAKSTHIEAVGTWLNELFASTSLVPTSLE